jgi:hypothetical protein
MADTKEEIKKSENWADLGSEEDDDNEEIGIQGESKAEAKEEEEVKQVEKKSWK